MGMGGLDPTTAWSGTDVCGCCARAHWCDLPERYDHWKTVHRRFSRWCPAGVGKRVFDTLAADRDNTYLMLDSTIVRAHQQAATGKEPVLSLSKQGPGTRRWGVSVAD